MGFIGTYADLTGFMVGNFSVLELAGRDRSRAPMWRCICQRCGSDQVFTHQKLTNRLDTHSATETLFCQHEACPLSRRELPHAETLRDIRLSERRGREEAERVAKLERDRAAKQAAETAAKEAALAPLRKDWHQYVRNRINYGKPVNEIMNFDRWLQIGESARTRIMELVRQSESQT